MYITLHTATHGGTDFRNGATKIIAMVTSGELRHLRYSLHLGVTMEFTWDTREGNAIQRRLVRNFVHVLTCSTFRLVKMCFRNRVCDRSSLPAHSLVPDWFGIEFIAKALRLQSFRPFLRSLQMIVLYPNTFKAHGFIGNIVLELSSSFFLLFFFFFVLTNCSCMPGHVADQELFFNPV